MSSETIVTALFLISAVVAAGVLISAIFPAIYRTSETFGSVSHEADVKMRTDIKIVNFFASGNDAKIWLKNVGTARISTNELDESDIFIGEPGDFERQALDGLYTLEGTPNNYWDPGETLNITVTSSYLPGVSGSDVYFAIVLSNGVRRSEEFTSS
ncbi:MAG TPA: flagellin [Methanoregulaceae archaeon]|nr:flagellin [Methanoregulaceae archaeon]